MNFRFYSLPILLGAVVLGYVVVAQLGAQKRLDVLVEDKEAAETIALEVESLVSAVDSLGIQNDALRVERVELESAIADQKQAKNKLVEQIERLEIVLGTEAAIGPGVRLNISSDLESIQVLDLINELKNAGAEVISVNGDRVIPTSSISGLFEQPILVEIIGDSQLLHTSLVRAGGILDQLRVDGEVEQVDSITLGSR